eukprot:COSAG01_NODE_1364_length_10563_cov_7.354931_7_plen_106_part_00
MGVVCGALTRRRCWQHEALRNAAGQSPLEVATISGKARVLALLSGEEGDVSAASRGGGVAGRAGMGAGVAPGYRPPQPALLPPSDVAAATAAGAVHVAAGSLAQP